MRGRRDAAATAAPGEKDEQSQKTQMFHEPFPHNNKLREMCHTAHVAASTEATGVAEVDDGVWKRERCRIVPVQEGAQDALRSIVLKLVHDGRFVDVQHVGVGIEFRFKADGEDPLVVDVTERCVRDDWTIEMRQTVVERFVDGERPAAFGFAVRALTEDDALRGGECSREVKLREHPIDAIWFFVGLFEQQNRVVRGNGIRRAAERGDETEIAARKASARASTAEPSHIRRVQRADRFGRHPRAFDRGTNMLAE